MKAIINLSKDMSQDVFSTLNGLSASISTFQQIMLQDNINKYVDDIEPDIFEDKRNRFGLFEPTKRENKFFFMKKFNFSYGSSHEIAGGSSFDNRVITSFFYNNIDVRVLTMFNLDLFSDLNNLSFLSKRNSNILISISSENMPPNDKNDLMKAIAKHLSSDESFYKLKENFNNFVGDKQWEMVNIKKTNNNSFEP